MFQRAPAQAIAVYYALFVPFFTFVAILTLHKHFVLVTNNLSISRAYIFFISLRGIIICYLVSVILALLSTIFHGSRELVLQLRSFGRCVTGGS